MIQIETGLRRLNYFVIVAAMILAAASCKKDEEDTTLPSLEGNLMFTVPEFISPGQTVTMTPKGAVHPDGGTIGYYWKISPLMEKYDTTRYLNGLDDPDSSVGKPSDGSFTYVFPDTLKSYTIYMYAYATGYARSDAYNYVTIVRNGRLGSVRGIAQLPDHVVSDGLEYQYRKNGSLEWTIDNMAAPSAGAPYRSAEVMSDIFGRYYSYDEAMAVCESLNEEGAQRKWRLPSEEDWTELCRSLGAEIPAEEHQPIPGVASSLMVNATFNDKVMWEYWPEVGTITNSSRMSVIPVGYANLGSRNQDGKYPLASFFGAYEYAAFWTADKVEGTTDKAYYRYLVCDQPDLFVSEGDISSFGASVRCVRDAE